MIKTKPNLNPVYAKIKTIYLKDDQVIFAPKIGAVFESENANKTIKNKHI